MMITKFLALKAFWIWVFQIVFMVCQGLQCSKFITSVVSSVVDFGCPLKVMSSVCSTVQRMTKA